MAHSAMGVRVGNQVVATSNMVVGIPMAEISITVKLPTGDVGPKKLQLNCQK